MRNVVSGWMLLIVAGLLAGESSAQEPAPDAELLAKIEKLIVQLDDENFQTREDAEKALTALGDQTIGPVTKATRSNSAEVRQRAERILRTARQLSLGLRHVATVRRDDLPGICSLTTSADGKFVYAAAFQTNTVAVFRRDEAMGGLTHVQSLTDADNLNGVVCLKLNDKGTLAVAVSFRSQKVSLLTRDADTGMLTVAHSAGPELAAGVSLVWPIDGVFSPEGKHVYVVDDRGASLSVFEVADGGKLNWVQHTTGIDECFAGARGVAVSPDGKTVLVTSNRSGTLTALARDPATGRVTLTQVLKDGEDKVTALMGAHGVVFSPDGQQAYATIGRFHGDQAVGVYQVTAGPKVAVIQELVSDKSDLTEFQGGNGVCVSADGLSVYACGTVSQSVASFRRNPKTGELSFVATLRNATTGTGGELGAADVDCSPDGRFLHVALEGEGAISVFERTAKK